MEQTIEWSQGDKQAAYQAALHLREEVFMQEQGFTTEADATDAVAHHLLLWENGKLSGTARLYEDQDGRWHAGRIAVCHTRRGAGLGAVLMGELEQKAIALGAKRIALSAQVKARGFYEACGYRVHGSFYYDEYCPHIDMEKTLTQTACAGLV